MVLADNQISSDCLCGNYKKKLIGKGERLSFLFF